MNMGWLEYLTVFLLTMGLIMLLAGIFTAYFGTGRSRAIGAILLVLGLVIGIFGGFYYYKMNPGHLLELIKSALLLLLSAIGGAVVAVVVFLAAIMKA
ncbi:MAG: hypothetical protein N3F63_00365 [Thermoplasmata archaeon]|nr:hypothetical protein [Thermoplasmata archaeon]